MVTITSQQTPNTSHNATTTEKSFRLKFKNATGGKTPLEQKLFGSNIDHQQISNFSGSKDDEFERYDNDITFEQDETVSNFRKLFKEKIQIDDKYSSQIPSVRESV